MKGYIRVPLYKDGSSSPVAYIRVYVIDRELNDTLQNSYVTFNDGNAVGYLPSVKYLRPTTLKRYNVTGSSIGKAANGESPTALPNSLESAIGLNSIMRENLEQLFNINLSAVVTTESEYNLTSIYNIVGDGEVYTKDRKIVIKYSTVDNSYGKKHSINIGGFSRSWYDGNYPIAGEGLRTENTMDYLSAQTTVNNSSGNSFFHYGYFVGLYILDNMSNINLNEFVGIFEKDGLVGKENTASVYVYGGYAYWEMRLITNGTIWNSIITDPDGDVIKQIEDSLDGGYVDDTPDSDNTYPGGGDDKNTYPPDGESGKGTFDNRNDEIDFPTLPTWDATSTGFISMWNPNMAEILDLYSFLWDSDFGTSVKKLFNEPMDAIISLAYFPVDPIISGKRNVTIGHVDSEIQMNHVSKQFCEFDFGSSRLDEYYGAAWDYSPYTRCSIYLPYIGVQPLNIDDVMNSDLHLKYHIDLLTGSCVAMLKSTRTRDGIDGVTYTWTGNCGMQVPITSGSAKEFITSMIQASAIAGLAMVNPCAGALTAGYAASHKTSPEVQSTGGGQWVNPTMGAFAALNVIGQKVDIQRGSKVEANAGVISPQCAYLIIERPVSAIPKGWNEYAGYPSLKIKALSTQKGLTQVAYIKLNDLEATAAEISELDSILKGGVYL